ncbi:MAG: cytochrome c biogenesis protein CcsA [Armatimonadia bacterium]
MTTLGLIGVYLAVAASAGGALLGLSRPGATRVLRACRVVALIGCGLAFCTLTVLVATGDVTVAYAQDHRAPADAPVGYRIAAVWAGQAGGLLLWCLEMALVTLFLSPQRQPRATAVLFAIQTCLLGLVALGNPFAPASSESAGGLNPLLQHPMMLIHPPMLFLGYALLSVPYALTLGALIDGTPDRWPRTVWPWTLVSWLALTFGNGFGAEWAYKTFGWGGFWSWDPVENTSFVPWILCAATVHCLWLSGRRPRALRWAAVCALTAYLAVLYGSFLARSGLLAGASVHAYVVGEKLMQWALTALLSLAAVAAGVFLALRWRSWAVAPEAETETAPTGTSSLVTWGVGALLGIAFLVLVGMSLPMFGPVPQTLAYNTFLMPLGVLLLVLMVLSVTGAALPPRLASVLGLAVAALVVVIVVLSLVITVPDGYARITAVILAPLLLIAGLTGCLECLWQLLRRRRPLLQSGSLVAHLGVAALLSGAVMSGYGTRSDQGFLPLGSQAAVAGHDLRLKSVQALSPEVIAAELDLDGEPASVQIEHSSKFSVELKRAWIRRGLLRDLYLTPLALLAEPSVLQGQKVPAGAMLQVSRKPGISLVWAGLLLMALGLFLALLRRLRSLPQKHEAT